MKANIYKDNIKNWEDVEALNSGKIKKTDVYFKTGEVFKDVLKPNTLVRYINRVEPYTVTYSLKEHAHLMKSKHMELISTNPDVLMAAMHDTFRKRVYGMVDVKGKVVLDIGACIGDSALFFAMHNAKSVLAYEPDPNMYSQLVSNIERNEYEGCVVPYWAGVGDEDGIAQLQVCELPTQNHLLESECHYSSSQIKSVAVDIAGIGGILEREDVDMTKMDCQGSEYAILQKVIDKGLSLGDEVVVEAHTTDNGGNPGVAHEMMLALGYDVRYVEGSWDTPRALIYGTKKI